jgi:nitroreductase
MVVDKPELLARISEMRDFGSAFIAGAPCGVLVMGDTATDLWLDNAAISATILQLVAQDAGLGSCWVHVNGRLRWSREPSEGMPRPANPTETATDYLRTFLPIPADWNPLCFVALGYHTDMPKPHRDKDDSDKIMWL